MRLSTVRIICVALCIPLATAGACAPSAREEGPPPSPVAHVDLERYVGLWYEIAKVPNRFQAQCTHGTTARYTLRDDGRMTVTNRCVKADGTISEATGIARVVDAASNARLQVSFVRFLGIQLFWGDYWIIGLGEDYEYAIVGTPDRKYGWILGREPAMAPERLEHVFSELRAQDYDPDDFEMTPH
jgi:apolipoprotein D and lipocalin family protein